MSIWSDLTDRHKKYAALALLVGTIIGLISTIGALIILSLLFGMGLSLIGGISIYIRNRYDKEEITYRTWTMVAIVGIISGLLCFGFAIVGLYAHQMGWI
jgi:MFS family permease